MTFSMLEKRLAFFFSLIFHPLLMPFFGTLIILENSIFFDYIKPEYQSLALFQTLLLVFLSTFALPVSILPIIKYLQLIKTVEMNTRQERITPLLVTTFAFYFAIYAIGNLSFPVPPQVRIFLLASILSIIVTLIISTFWKVSLHMVGIGGVVGLITQLHTNNTHNQIIILATAFLVAAVIAFSRLKLNKHTQAQIYVGFFTGISTVWLTFSMF